MMNASCNSRHGMAMSSLVRWLVCGLVGPALISASALASAQTYPGKLLRLVVPFAPAGPVDITGRMLAQKFNESSGQSVVVENRAGAGTIIGTEYVVKSSPDGHTLLLAPTQIAINPSMYAKLPYDTLKDLIGITQLTNQPYLLIAYPSAPFRTVKELITVAKAKSGTVRCASSGAGAGSHLACEMFNKMTGAQITHVPYKSAPPALNGTISGEVEIYFSNPITAVQLVTAGRLRALAFTGTKRVGFMPEVPTITESDIPGYDAGVWFGLFTTGGTPRDVVRRINQETIRILALSDIRKNLTSEGGDIVGSTPEQFAEFMKVEVAKWTEIVKFSGAKAD